MKGIRSIIVGIVIVIAVYILGGISYRIARHSFETSNEIRVIEQSLEVDWCESKVLPSGLGFIIATPLVSSTMVHDGEPSDQVVPSVTLMTGNKTKFIALKSQKLTPLDSELASREISNRFGTVLCSWKCSVSGELDAENDEYYLWASASGGGDAGYTISFDIRDCGNLEFELTVVERLWSNDARECTIRYRIEPDGEITAVTT